MEESEGCRMRLTLAGMTSMEMLVVIEAFPPAREAATMMSMPQLRMAL